MLIYDVLKSDHNKVKSLLNELVSLDEHAKKRGDAIIEKIRDELIPHSRAEEAIFYNSIRVVAAAKDLVWHGYEEHMMAEALLRTLQAASKIDVNYLAIAKKLKTSLEHHIQEEESKIFDAAKALFTSEEAEVMADAFQSMKPKIREEGLMQTTLDLIANVMPARLAGPLRSFTLNP